MVKQVMKSAWNNTKFLYYGGRLGFHCTHFYTNHDAFATYMSSNPLSDEQMKRLKGNDLVFATAVTACRLDVYLVPYVSYRGNEEGYEQRLSKFPKKKPCPVQMGGVDPGIGLTLYATNLWVGEVKPDEDDYAYDYQRGKNPKEQFFGETEYSETGCFGNEASDTSFYVKEASYIDCRYPCLRRKKQHQNLSK